MNARNGRAREELTSLLSTGDLERGTVLRKIKSAADRRRKAQEAIDEASEELAIWTKAGAAIGIQMSDMTDRSGYSRELMYYLQREHGLGKARSA